MTDYLTMERPFEENLKHNYFRTVKDIKDCVEKLKVDYQDTKTPINDDNTSLHKLFAKMEYLFQMHFKGSAKLFSRRTEYWNFLYDCLDSRKTLSDGLRFVKSLTEVKTNLGRGRALIRFSLVHQRLGEMMQSCSGHEKAIIAWYDGKAVWFYPDVVKELVVNLYDLNEIMFDLTAPPGCDLDTAWPTFARQQYSSNWQPPSRTMSISSLNSLPGSVKKGAEPSSNANSVDQEVGSVKSQLEEVEKEKEALEMDYGELEERNIQLKEEVEDLKFQLHQMEEKFYDVQGKCSDLNIKYEKASTTLELRQEMWAQKESMLRERMAEDHKMVEQLEAHLAQQSQLTANTGSEREMKAQLQANETKRRALEIQLNSIEKELSSRQKVDQLKDKLVAMQEKKINQMRRVNDELVQRLDNMAANGANTHLLNALQGELRARTEAYEKLLEKNTELTSMLHDIEDKARKISSLAKDKLQKYSRENRELKDQLAQQQAGSVAAGITGLQKQLEETLQRLPTPSSSEEVIKELQTAVTQLESQVARDSDRIELENKELRLEISRLQAQLEQTNMSTVNEMCNVPVCQVDLECLSMVSNASTWGSATDHNEESGSDTADRSAGDLALDSSEGKVAEESSTTRGETYEGDTMTDATLEELASDLHKQLREELEELDKVQEVHEEEMKKLQLTLEEAARGKVREDAMSTKEVQTNLQSAEGEQSFILEELQQELARLHEEYDEFRKGQEALAQSMAEQAQKDEQEKDTLIKKYHALETSKEETLSNLNVATAQLADLQDNLERLRMDYEDLQALEKDLSHKCEHLTSHNHSLQESLDALAQAKKDIQDVLMYKSHTISKLEGEMASLELEKQTLAAQCEQVEKEKVLMSPSENRVAEMEAAIVKEQQRAHEAENRLSQLEEEIRNEQDRVGRADNRVVELEAEIEKERSRAVRAENRVADLEAEVEREQERVGKAENRVFEREAEVEKEQEEVSRAENRVIELEAEIKKEQEREHRAGNKVAELEKEVEREQERVGRAENRVVELEDEIEKEMKRAGRAESRVVELEEEIEKEKTRAGRAEKRVADLEVEVEKEQERVGRAENRVVELEEEIEKEKSRAVRAENRIADMEAEVEREQERVGRAENRVFELEAEVEKEQKRALGAENRVTELESQLEISNRVAESLQVLEQNARDFQAQISELQSAMGEKDITITNLQDEINALSTDCNQLREKEKECMALIMEQDTLKEQLHKEIADANKQKLDILAQLESRNKEMSELHTQLEDAKEQCNFLQARETELLQKSGQGDTFKALLHEKEEAFANLKTVHEEEVRSLMFQLSSEQLGNQKSVQEFEQTMHMYESMQIRVHELENNLQDCKHELIDKAGLLRALEEQMDDVKEQLTMSEEKRAGLQQDIDKRTQEHEDQFKEMNTFQAQMQEQFTTTIDTLNNERALLTDENNQLRKKLIKLIRSKDDLTRKLLNLNQTRKNLLRTLHVIDQEKDSLWKKLNQAQNEMEVQATTVWEDGAAVSTCHTCGSSFSLFVRQHHCRLCGQIFCHNCCNNWIKTAHSSKDVRVCCECYRQHSCHSSPAASGHSSDSDRNEDEDEPMPTLKSPKWKQLAGKRLAKGHEQEDVTDEDDEDERDAQDSVGSEDEHRSVGDTAGPLQPNNDQVTAQAPASGEHLAEGSDILENRQEQNKNKEDTDNQEYSKEQESPDNEPKTTQVGECGEDGVDHQTGVEQQEQVPEGVWNADASNTEDQVDGKEEQVDEGGNENEGVEGKYSSGELSKSVPDEGPINLQVDYYTNVMEIIDTKDFEERPIVQNDPGNDLWIGAWRALLIPVLIEEEGSVLKWEFETYPKDINFGLRFLDDPLIPVDQAEVLIPLCKCNSHKKTMKGELMARKPGLYILTFDNKYSKITSKKLMYRLQLSLPE